MAEKYGVIPKRFSKEWWKYFWGYYKFHVIVVTFIVIALLTTLIGKLTAPKYDLTLTYAGYTEFMDSYIESSQKRLSFECPDTNKNGESLLKLNVFSFPKDDSIDPEYTMAMLTKFTLTIGEDEAFIYVIEKDFLDNYMLSETNHSSFAKVSDWCNMPVAPDKTLEYGGSEVAVSLDGNDILRKAGVPTDETYLLVRYAPRKDQKEQENGYKSAVEFANTILGY